jgi:tRNA 5-methylaminomethyl-2-thiouridine biosynthesis bifunctional protein
MAVTDIKTPLISSPQVLWKNGSPVSSIFDDVYFSTENGLDESKYVFIEGNDLERRWTTWTASHPRYFTVIETGFGTGLNFLATWDLWEKTAPAGCRLHYVSTEKYPMKVADILFALNRWPQFSDKLSALLQSYPQALPGMHRIILDNGNIHLTLLWGDASASLATINETADAWFLDGFSPSKNPDMWSTSLFRQMARLSGDHSTLSTFTAASKVRKGLIAAGFQIEKKKGYKFKREMLVGRLAPSDEPDREAESLLCTQKTPWYINASHSAKKLSTAVVIGGGIAGATSAHALSRNGFQVELIERGTKLANAASGNPTGVLFTKLNPEFSIQNYFYQQSYLYAIRHMLNLSAKESATDVLRWQQCGMLQLAFSEKEGILQKQILASDKWSREIAQAVTAQQASEISGVPQSTGGLFLPQSGWVDPASLCAALLHNNKSIHIHYNQNALTLLQAKNKRWNVLNTQQQLIASADIVVIANSNDALHFSQSAHLPLKTIRGQISLIPTTKASAKLTTLLNYDGYIAPSRNGFHCIGATFHPKDSCSEIRKNDHLTNLGQLNRACPELYNMLNVAGSLDSVRGRTSFRCQAPDYLPVVGPLPELESFIHNYAGLRTGRLKEKYPKGHFYPGLYINTAYGSRGLTSAPLCSEILLSHITGEPQPIETDVVNALHPARFIIRQLKRRLI